MNKILPILVCAAVLSVPFVAQVKVSPEPAIAKVQEQSQQVSSEEPPLPEATPEVNPTPAAEPPSRAVLAVAPPPERPKQYPQGCEAYRHLIEKYSWSVDIAMAVMKAESGCNPNRANWNDIHRDSKGKVICKGSFGLFQISCHSGELYDPEKNVEAAWQKYKARGWIGPWGVCKSTKKLGKTVPAKVKCY